MGMGWFRPSSVSINTIQKIFVPAWGWVGSSGLRYDSIVLCENFRPRLGMGWFQKIIFKGAKSNDFRPRLGMGWFVDDNYKKNGNKSFSSPLGDGLVPYLLLSH